MTVLPLDRGEYSSEIGDCLKNSSFEATTIRYRWVLDVLKFINLLSRDVRADYWFHRAPQGIPMRLILGIILGAAFTVGGAYIADSAAGAGGAKMVNWDVVAKNLDEVSAATRAGWKRITG